MGENSKPPRFEKLVAVPAKLVDLVDYQEGSVVSRTIIDKKTGTVTLFAFDEGQGLSEHTAPFDATVCLLDGEAGRMSRVVPQVDSSIWWPTMLDA